MQGGHVEHDELRRLAGGSFAHHFGHDFMVSGRRIWTCFAAVGASVLDQLVRVLLAVAAAVEILLQVHDARIFRKLLDSVVLQLQLVELALGEERVFLIFRFRRGNGKRSGAFVPDHDGVSPVVPLARRVAAHGADVLGHDAALKLVPDDLA